MASTAGSVLLEITANLERLKADIERAMADAGNQAGRTFSDKFSAATAKLDRVGASMTRNLTVPILATGTAAVTMALSVDDALDKIRTSTGATGDDLAGLEASFRTIASSSTQDLTSVADVLSALAVRTDLTGPALETLAGQVLDLQQLLGEPINLDNLTRVFSAYQIAPEQYAETLDRMYRASQATGVGFQDLQSLVVTQSAAFSELGFSLDETTALIGQFQAAGVNTETVLSALRQNIAKAAAAGQSAGDFFRSGVAEIEGFIAAGDEAAAQAAAKELFGARTFLDALDAIRRGQFNIDGTIAQIRAGGDSISALADETADFPEQFAQFKNQLALSLGELGSKLFPILTQAVEQVLPVLTGLFDAFSNLDPGVQTFIIGALGVVAAIGPALSVLSKLSAAIKGVGIALQFLSANPWVLAIAAIAGVAFLIYKNWDKIGPIFEAVGEVIADVAQAVAGWVIDYIWEPLKSVWEWLKKNWDLLLPILLGPFGAVILIIRRWGDDILRIIRGAWDAIVGAVRTAVNFVKSIIETVFNAIRTVVETVIGAVKAYIELQLNIITAVFNAFRDAVAVVWGAIRSAIETATNIIRGILDGLGRAVDTVRGAFETAGNLIASGWTWVRDTVGGAVDWLIEKLTDLKDWLARNADKLLGPLDEIAGFAASGIGALGDVVGLATGGTASAGRPYLVGEEGPELMVPGRTGQIVPTDRLLAALGTGGSGGDAYTITVVNPVAEPTSLSIARLQRRQALLTGRSA